MPICTQCGAKFEKPGKRPGSTCSPECFCAKESADSRRRAAAFSPERRQASNLVYTAIRQGKLIPQPCEVCGKRSFIIAHHDDYAAPLDVRWLCRTHHRKHHDQHGPGRNA